MGSGINNIVKLILSPKYAIASIKRNKLQKKYKVQGLVIGLNSEIVDSTIGKFVALNFNVVFRNSSIGDHSYVNSNTHVYNTAIGKFCSIGSNVQFGLGMHPTSMVSTHPAFFSKGKMFKTFSDEVYVEEYSEIVVGNDVWIGDGAVIMNGVTIEDGAVVAARAVVTKDVKAYSIVGGIPAKILKFRFDEEIIKNIKKTKWWDWEEERFEKEYKLFHDPDEFISKFV